MIIGSHIKRQIGEIVKTDSNWTLWDNYAKPHVEQPYMVLREATIEEWCDSLSQLNIESRIKIQSILEATSSKTYFYEISLD